VERHVDARKGNGSETSLKLDVALGLLLLLGLFMATRDNILQHLLDLLDSKLLSKLNAE
jgi:hypothetical protein